jgi:hypothetical protein
LCGAIRWESLAVNATDAFVEEYRAAKGPDVASISLIDALGILVLQLKHDGCSAERVIGVIRKAITDGGGHSSASKRLDEELLAHCIEEYYRPSERSPMFDKGREESHRELR